ncbi:MAG: DivIVA domain-containing protein [Clostridiales bacterium]|nr:DivIVA domain-containing protein [Clostridiales bacterium]
MMTPQEIEQKKFEKAVFGGYDMSSVDDFLDVMTEDYTTLYKENVALKAKLKVLVDKIEEYRSVDDAMRKALLTAQNTAREIVEKAKKESDALTSNAREDADRKIAFMKDEILSEEKKLSVTRAKVNEYIREIIELHKKSLLELESQNQITAAEEKAEEKPDERDTQVFGEIPLQEEKSQSSPGQVPEGKTQIDDIDKAVLKASENAFMKEKYAAESSTCSTDGMEVKVYEVQLGEQRTMITDDTGEIMSFTPKPKFNFENLKFGKDYKESND